MDIRFVPSTAGPESAEHLSAPPAAESLEPEATSQTAPLRPRYILVEDVDHLVRTGISRQVLAIRWVR